MNRAAHIALKTIEKYQTNDPEKILDKLGVDVLDVPLLGEVKEIAFDDHIVLKQGIDKAERNQLLGHALCHRLMHAGNDFLRKQRRYSIGSFQEKQADVFAAYLLMPETAIEKLIGKDLTIFELAEKFDVLPYFVKFRIGLAKHYNPKKYAFLWGESAVAGQ